MQKISGLTKYLGVPSLATLTLGGGLLVNSANARNEVEEIYREVPIVRQLDSVERTVGNLDSAQTALTDYLVSAEYSETNWVGGQHGYSPVNSPGAAPIITHHPATYHHPNVNESVTELESVRSKIEGQDFSENPEIQSMSSKLQKVQTGLEQTEKGKPEDFYKPFRDKIGEVKADTEKYIAKLSKEIPSSVLDKRASLQNKQKASIVAGFILSIFGGIGSSFYGATKLFSRKLGLD